MARVKIDLPSTFHFTTQIPVRITDLNYGGHVGNDAVLGMLHEARMRYLGQWGYTELDVAGVGLIMSDAILSFKGESFYGDVWTIHIRAAEFNRVGFELYYAVETVRDGRTHRIAEAKTGMICFDYTARKPVGVPAAFAAQVEALG
ncbi:acyl-CoA thioesterase [Dinghuibacter silviterrae]|uniref:Acyl-CoA thioesterase FadM n=1 Tax=Dinghuibacter silviterrae TaxID=1539049 RepID=A0A4R8DR56_9BACT|nr:thioesterase family protein [Dinghuibacter silviterrae]TDX00662.1 acyl-CoA thioesterase FadM [Dinghuibacter silviterrae]